MSKKGLKTEVYGEERFINLHALLVSAIAKISRITGSPQEMRAEIVIRDLKADEDDDNVVYELRATTAEWSGEKIANYARACFAVNYRVPDSPPEEEVRETAEFEVKIGLEIGLKYLDKSMTARMVLVVLQRILEGVVDDDQNFPDARLAVWVRDLLKDENLRKELDKMQHSFPGYWQQNGQRRLIELVS